MKLLLDMNLSPEWVPFLNAAGIPATHWSDIGRADAPDVDVMEWARAHDCVVFTNDLGFSALLAMTRRSGPSVLQLRLQDLLPDAVGDLVLRAVGANRDLLLRGAILTVTDNGSRVRVLPLGPEPA